MLWALMDLNQSIIIIVDLNQINAVERISDVSVNQLHT